jgi:SNW domain-containing protein 1
MTNQQQTQEERLQRDRLRAERRREREKEYRLERAGLKSEEDMTEEELAKKKRRLENDRDVSEKIALGTHVGNSGGDGVDSRLYSQNAGLDSGFGAEDEYNTYSRPMFDREGVTSSSIYRPTRGEGALDAEEQYDKLKRGTTEKFVPSKGFGGAEGVKGGAARSAPVQFEKAK